MPSEPFTPRALPAEQLRDRWAHHNARVIAGGLLALGLLITAVTLALTGAPLWQIGCAAAALALAKQWIMYHFGAARAITRIAFGDKR